ncbi:sensor histidine kinase [Streptomyces sp. NPDC059786]|uniref:sensor histidine kinase n=1 Tax=Streptomyces sp. NPDC059786 TaxID=3346946 RepID=UPI003651B6F5
MTAPLPPGERPTFRTVAPAPAITAVLSALVVAGAVAAAPDSVRVPLAWGAGAGAVLLCVAVAVAARSLHAARLTRRRLDAVAADSGRLLQERARLADELSRERGRLAEEFAQERARLADEATRESARIADELGAERIRLTEEFAQERKRLTADRARLADDNARLNERARQAAHARDAAVAATANAAGRMQALATGMLADLRAMEERHSDEDVLADLLHLDHRTAQAGRLADSVAVLAGARSGRRWARPIVMESILRGAMGRISGYQRVRIHSTSEAAVSGHAAEGVMHAVAELLDNAANFSPPTAEVHVYVEEVPAGVIVSVEDSGLVMSDVQLRRAEQAVSGEASDLGGITGTRLGLAVVGRLARKHGLKVSFRPSARGGTGVLVLVPQELLSTSATPPAALPKGSAAGSSGASGAVTASRTATASGAAGTSAASAASGATGESSPSQTSYAAARATGDLDPDPVPTHESPARAGTGIGTGITTGADTASADTASGGLPKRRRGRTLAEAERRAQAASTARVDREPPTAEQTKARAARFSSFRQAVRNTVPDQAAVQGSVPEETRPEDIRPEDIRPDETRPEETRSGETRSGETRPADSARTEAPRSYATAAAGAPARTNAPDEAEREAVSEPANATASPPPAHSHPEGDTTS